MQVYSVNKVTLQRLFILGFHKDTWYLKLFCIDERLINPGFNHPSIQIISGAAHAHNFLYIVLKVIPVVHLVLAEASSSVLLHHCLFICSNSLRNTFTTIDRDTDVLWRRSMSIHVLETSLDSLLTFLGLESCEARVGAASLCHIEITLRNDHIRSMLHILCKPAFSFADVVAGLWPDI